MGDALVAQAVDKLGSALAILDADGTVVCATDAWTQLDVSGTVPAAATVDGAYLPACETIADESTATAAREAFGALLTGERERAEIEYDRPRAEALPRRFRLRGRRFTADDGVYVVVEHTEQTEAVRTERELEHYRGTLADLATVVSHDIRSPLTAALSWSELLGAEAETDTEKLDRIVSGLERTNAIADDAVTLARKTAVDEVEPVEVGRVAKHVWEHIDSTGFKLAVEDTVPVLADERALKTLLEHLLRNAVQHSTDGGGNGEREERTVEVGPLTDGFYVEDEGKGIDEDVRDNLFEVGVTTSPGDGSTGIGLAVVTRAAEAHGWTVDIADTGTGSARFEITGVSKPS